MEGAQPASKKKAKLAKKKKIRYHKYTFSVSSKEWKLIEKFCKKQHLVPTMMFKTAIRDFMLAHARLNDDDVLENQLNLFEEMFRAEEPEETFPEDNTVQSEIVFHEPEE